jgi:hypothetical protein
VEDGSGVDSALKLGTGEVEVNGTLKFSSAPSEDTSELTQLMLNSSNVVVRQEKSANSIGDIDSGWKALPLNTNNSGTFTGVNYVITTDGKLEVRPFPDYDNAIVDGTADTHQTYSWAELQMKLDTNDTMHLVDYDAYKNGRISSGAGADQRIVTNTGQDSPFAFE